jgi:aldehyde:ferredoxin oxidoreductase
MAALKGMAGKIARVDLSSGSVTVIEPPEDVYRKYLGGSALGMYYLFKEGVVEPSVDPLGPDNLLQFMVGPITGAGPNARSTIVTKSPYNFICSTTSGGQAAAELKFAGWDGIQVVGKAKSPVYIAVLDEVIEIRDASHVWGMGAEDAEIILKGEVTAELETREPMLRTADLTPEWAAMRPPARIGIGERHLAQAWLIGPGGENQVWYACVMTEGARAHGRYGAGAVAGSKNLKAVVIRGTKGHAFYDKKLFMERVNAILATEITNTARRNYGTTAAGERSAYVEDAYPIRNWQFTSWADPNTRSLTGPFMEAASFVTAQACPNCHFRCLFPIEITSEDPMMDGVLTDMPDWEAMGMVGGMLGYCEAPGKTPADTYTGTMDDQAEALAKTQYSTFIHDNMGLDFIEGGALLGLLMELRQRNLITPADLDGIDLQWGDVHAVDAIVTKLVKREGIGDVLAKGTWETAKYFADKKGKPEIMRYSMTGHRYGQPAHDVRSPKDKNAMEYVTVNLQCNHTGGGGAGFHKKDYEAATADQNIKAAVDSLVACNFARANLAGKTVDLIQAATGWNDFTEEEYLAVGARAYALSRLFDIHTQQLTDPKEQWDKLVPPRWFEDPLPAFGPQGGALAYDGDTKTLFDVDLPAYWKVRGWTEDKGIPTLETLKKLGIDDVAEAVAKKHL